MGKKGSWFSALKRALSFESKNKCFGKYEDSDSDPVPSSQEPETNVPAPPPPVEDVKLTEVENEQNKHAQSVALATAAAAEVAVAAAQAAAEVVRLTSAARYTGKSEEEIAAIKIQTAFRGYLARRALRALRGLVRLRSLIHGQSVKWQATTTLRCMQTLARVQSQIRARRIRMSEENQALQRQLQQKNEKELEKLRGSVTIGDDWNDSTQSKEQVEAKLQSKQEAAMRRERALAYSFSHQQMWKNSSKSATPTFMDPNNPHWGWSWLERWMASRPWENQSAAHYNDRASLKSAASRAASVGEISKSYSRRDNNSSPTPQKPSPTSKAPSSSSKTKPPSPKGSSWGGDDDSRSMLSAQSERYRRHSIASSSVRDDNDKESMPSSPSSVPSYMVPTKSAKAKSRLPSPLGTEKNAATPEKGSGGSAKKRLSFSASPAGPRRHSGPPNLDSSPINEIGVAEEEKISNGENM